MLDCIALLVVAAAAAAAAAAPGAAQDPEPIERLEAWPDIEDESAAKREMSRLRVAQTEAMGEEGGAALPHISTSASATSNN
jgi:hypothetical protein